MEVATSPGCTWSVLPVTSPNVTGISVQPPGSGAGPGKAFFAATPNPGTVARFGTYLVQGQSVTVFQPGAISANPGDEPATALSIPTVPDQVLGANTSLTQNPADPLHSCTQSSDFKSGWWSFTAPADGQVQVAAQGISGNSDTGIALTAYPLSGGAVGPELACATVPKKTGARTFGTITFPVSQGARYAVEVSTLGNTSSDYAAIAIGVAAAGPALAASISPATASLMAGQKQQFTATIGGLANTAVRWTVSPQTGVIAPDGTYTAPPSATPTTVTVTAQSLADSTLRATSTGALIRRSC